MIRQFWWQLQCLWVGVRGREVQQGQWGRSPCCTATTGAEWCKHQFEKVSQLAIMGRPSISTARMGSNRRHTFIIIMDKATIDELLASLEAVAASAQGSQSSGNNGDNNSDSARSGEDGSEPPFHIVQLGSHASATLVPK